MEQKHSHRIYRMTEWIRQVFAVATLGGLILVQPLRESALQWASSEPLRAVRTVGTSSREFASGPSVAVGKPIARGGQS